MIYIIGTPNIKAPKNQLAPNWYPKKKFLMNNGITINEDDKYSGCQNTKIAGINVIIQKEYNFINLSS